MILSAPPAAHMLCNIPDGAAGVRATLKVMTRMVKAQRVLPRIREKVADLTMMSMGNYTAEVNACFCYVRDAIRYLGDVNGVETLQEPIYTLDHGFGDCDDKSTLLACMLESISHPCRFVAAGYRAPNVYEHVWVETLIGREWIACETTENVDLGWAAMPPNIPERITAKMVEYI